MVLRRAVVDVPHAAPNENMSAVFGILKSSWQIKLLCVCFLLDIININLTLTLSLLRNNGGWQQEQGLSIKRMLLVGVPVSEEVKRSEEE
jgi:hypothetical protein